MTGRRIAALLCAGLLLIAPASAQFVRQDAANPAGAGRLAGPPIVLDAHVDSLHRILDRGDDLSETLPDGQVDLHKLRAGGVNAVWFALWVNPDKYHGEAATRRAVALMEALQTQVSRHSDILVFCRTAADVRRAAAQGRIAALAGVENGIAINNDLRMIGAFHRMGATRMVLTWRGNLPWAGSSQSDNPARGLNAFGREVVREMNRLGMVVDLSHTSKQTSLDALEVSALPVIFSHSNASALSPHARNVDDELLRRLNANGGVIGVNFYDAFLRGPRRSVLSRSKPDVGVVLDHIDHIVRVAGIDHVGIGSDWDGGITPVRGLEDASKMPLLFKGMRQRGYSEADIRKVAGENFLRVLEANERGAVGEIPPPPKSRTPVDSGR